MESKKVLWANFIAAITLFAFAGWVLWWQNNRIDAGAAATLIGALFGGAVLLLANGILSWIGATQLEIEQTTRLHKVRALVTAELVAIAASHIYAKELINLATAGSPANQGQFNGTRLFGEIRRDLSLTFNLGSELLALSKEALDAIATLAANLSESKTLAESLAVSNSSGYLGLQKIKLALSNDMEVLAQCFERISPDRKLALPGQSPRPAGEILRALAK